MQHVHQLTFVLVNTLDLHIKQSFRVDDHVKLLADVVRQPLLVFQLGLAYRLIDLRIVDMLLQLLQLT